MGNVTNLENYSAKERLHYLERVAYWRGWVRRSDVAERFGVSVPQASADFAAYLKANPKGLTYNPSAKRYEGAADMRCVLGAPDLADGLSVLSRISDAVSQAHIDLPNRTADPSILRDTVRATARSAPIKIYYFSVHSDRESWRTIVPRAFAHDGYRWHIRAWCVEDGTYKDFVVGRITRTKASIAKILAPPDPEWDTWVRVRVRPHRNLGIAQRKAIEHDFAMKRGLCSLKVRKAMLGYTLAYLGVSVEERPRLLELAEG